MRLWPCPTKQRSNGNSGTTSLRKCGRKRSGSAASNSRAPGRSEALTRDARRCPTRGHYRASCPSGPQQCLHHCHGPNLQQRINLMSQAVQSISTSVKVRFPREMLSAINDWATEHEVPRSKAIRTLLYRAMMLDCQNWECDCDGPDACNG